MNHRSSTLFTLSVLLALAIGTACSSSSHAAALGADGKIPFPSDYRDWQHVKSMVIEPGHALHDAFGGIHHVYGNEAAIAGLRSGKYGDGAVFAFDLLTANAAGNAITEGERKVLGVMHRDATAFSNTGGWGFAGFDNARHDIVKDMRTQCFQCHEAQRDKGFVFTTWRP